MRSFSARLISWQEHAGRRDLPWQNTRDAYRIWVSEIMLQQTQVATVMPYYRRFLGVFPDVQSLAAASIDAVLQSWSGLGYYRRAHLLHRAAQEVVGRHGGVFPRDAAALATLPGVGRSTAAAIAAFAGGERGAILDGNVKRVLARHQGVEGHAGDPAVLRALWSRTVYAGADGPWRDGVRALDAGLCALPGRRRLRRAARESHRRAASVAPSKTAAAARSRRPPD
jgi:A/G-specific adenine glycosylase